MHDTTNGVSSPKSRAVPDLFVLVAQIALIILASRAVGFLFQKLSQPQVIGEMLAWRSCSGPSLLGWLAPGVSAALFPASSLGTLNAISQLGLVIYMFLVGLELNAAELRRYGKAAMLISHVSIVVPFVLAAMLSLYLYPRLAEAGVSFMSFALFMGAGYRDHSVSSAGAYPYRSANCSPPAWGLSLLRARRSTTSPGGPFWLTSWCSSELRNRPSRSG